MHRTESVSVGKRATASFVARRFLLLVGSGLVAAASLLEYECIHKRRRRKPIPPNLKRGRETARRNRKCRW
jgi:hypothetical protein